MYITIFAYKSVIEKSESREKRNFTNNFVYQNASQDYEKNTILGENEKFSQMQILFK